MRALDSRPCDAVKVSDFRQLGLQAVTVREESGKTSGGFYLENCREDEEFEVE